MYSTKIRRSSPARLTLAATGAAVILLGCATSEIGTDSDPGGTAADTADAADGAPRADSGPRPDSAVGVTDAAPDSPDGGGACELGTVTDCASCGDACPGVGTTAGAPACESSTCVFRCTGEAYDVNGDVSDGCEASDSPAGNHNSSGATNLGSLPCDDGSSNPNISGVLISDNREHTPAIAGFRAAEGAAPDFYKIFASGGLCLNEVVFDLRVSGSISASCYRLVVETNNGTYSCNTSAAGTCRINQGTSAYSDNSNILVHVAKTCAAGALTERVSYTVMGNL